MHHLKTVVALAIALLAGSVHADVAIIVHKDNPVTSLSTMEFTRIYLGRLSAFPDGSPAVPINQVADSDVRATMEGDLLHKSPSQMKAYWTKLMFTGDGTPPEEVAGDAAMISRVASDPAAIGYVDAGSVTDAVRVIAVQ